MGKLKKLALLAALLGMVLCYLSGQAVARAVQPAQDAPTAYLWQAFRATGSRFTGFEVHDWTTLNQRFLKQQAVRQLSQAIARQLGMRAPRLYQHSDGRDHVALWSGVVNLASTGDAASKRVAVSSLTATVELASMALPQAPAQTVLIIRLMANKTAAHTLATAYAATKQVVEAVGGRPQINETLFGELPGLRSAGERSRLIATAFAAAGARELEPMQSTYTTSVAGYGKFPVDSAQANGQALNLQIAMHANSFKNVTKVLVGSPIITVEY